MLVIPCLFLTYVHVCMQVSLYPVKSSMLQEKVLESALKEEYTDLEIALADYNEQKHVN